MLEVSGERLGSGWAVGGKCVGSEWGVGGKWHGNALGMCGKCAGSVGGRGLGSGRGSEIEHEHL